MRRREKEIRDDREIEKIIQRATVCRLGLCDKDSAYIVPVCFGYEPGNLWIHSAHEGKKITLVKCNPHVCFEFDEVVGIEKSDNPCSSGVKYRSVIGLGTAEIVDDIQEKIHGLSCIMNRYADAGSFSFPKPALDSVCVIRIHISEMTGKQSPANVERS